MNKAIENGLLVSRLGILLPEPELGYVYDIPPHGFKDAINFYDDYSDHKRVLVLGDSFAHGVSADPGKGFVALLQKHYKDKNITFLILELEGIVKIISFKF